MVVLVLAPLPCAGSSGDFNTKLDSRAGVESIIHEYFHYWLHYQTEPAGMLNDEQTVQRLTALLMASPEFYEWLKEVDNGG